MNKTRTTDSVLTIGQLEATITKTEIRVRLGSADEAETPIQLWMARGLMDLADEYPSHRFVVEDEDDDDCYCCCCDDTGSVLRELLALLMSPAPSGEGTKFDWYGRALAAPAVA